MKDFSLNRWLENKEQRRLHEENKERLRVEKIKEQEDYALKELHESESYKAEKWKGDIISGRDK